MSKMEDSQELDEEIRQSVDEAWPLFVDFLKKTERVGVTFRRDMTLAIAAWTLQEPRDIATVSAGRVLDLIRTRVI